MRNILAVCAKELYTYFVSPIAYFVCFVFTAILGFLFSLVLIGTSARAGGTGAFVMETIFGQMAIILLFFTPVLTMKLFAEERKTGTIELLLTSPITDGQVVLGKFFASWMLVLIMLGLTLLFPFLTQRFGYLDIGLLLSRLSRCYSNRFFVFGVRAIDVLNVQEPTRCGTDEFWHSYNTLGDTAHSSSRGGTIGNFPELSVVL